MLEVKQNEQYILSYISTKSHSNPGSWPSTPPQRMAVEMHRYKHRQYFSTLNALHKQS